MSKEIKIEEKVTEKKYETTKEMCQAIIDRVGRVCSCCGGKLDPIETVDNSDRPTYWVGCNACNKFDNGVPSDVYYIASKMVRERHLQPYSHLPYQYDATGEEKEYWFKTQTGGASSIVWMILQIKEDTRD